MTKTAQLLIAITLLASPAAVLAQGLEAGTMQSASPSSGLGPEHDSLLPPEVVPLDPQSAQTLSASQAAARQLQPVTTHVSGTNVPAPGLAAMPMAPGAATSSAQDFRRQAFESLYGQSQPPVQAMGGQWRHAGQEVSVPGLAGQPPGGLMPPPGMMPGMPASAPAGYPGGPVPGLAGVQGQPYPVAQASQLPGQLPPYAQGQVLSGGSKNQPQQRDIRRAGLSNVLSAATTFGAGALTSAVLMRPNNPWLGAGFFGMTMTGLGNRNNFRF